jgi:hypothetical protein
MDREPPEDRDQHSRKMNDDRADASIESKSLRTRLQYAGLILVAIVYLGGIAGWTYATLKVDSSTSAPAQIESADPDSSAGQDGERPNP